MQGGRDGDGDAGPSRARGVECSEHRLTHTSERQSPPHRYLISYDSLLLQAASEVEIDRGSKTTQMVGGSVPEIPPPPLQKRALFESLHFVLIPKENQAHSTVHYKTPNMQICDTFDLRKD